MKQTLFDSGIQWLIDALQGNPEAKVKEVLADTEGLKTALAQGAPQEQGLPTPPSANYENANNIFKGSYTAPETPRTPIRSQERMYDKDLGAQYEQEGFGLGGLRDAFMKEGITPQVDVGLQGYNNIQNKDEMIARINAQIFKQKEREQMNKTPMPGYGR